MKIQTDRKVEIFAAVEQAPGLITPAKDPENAGFNAPAINEGKDFAPDIPAKPGDIFILRVLE
jgi:hypothetical protein